MCAARAIPRFSSAEKSPLRSRAESARAPDVGAGKRAHPMMRRPCSITACSAGMATSVWKMIEALTSTLRFYERRR